MIRRCTLLVFMFAVLLPSIMAAASKRPNIILILTDDLGYGDVGVFMQNARRDKNDRSEPWHMTPNIDAMAAQGVQLRHYYCSAPVCAPSRASLLLGVHQGHANVRDNQFDKALENNHTIASVLKSAGYATAAIGKWGLQGGPKEGSPAAATASPADWPGYPTRRGFDYYFGYVRHQDGHWHYPKEDGRQVWENDREISADLDACYTTDLFTARAKKWILNQRDAHPSQPFFMYLAYDTPHAKLQLPPCQYPAGGGLKGGLQWSGNPGRMINTAIGAQDSYCHPDYNSATWDDDRNRATPERAWPEVYKRFATDVRRIDDCVGDLFALLRDLKIDRDTLVIFTSDNGPSQESYLKDPYEADFFNSFGPFDGIKRDCWEGGIRVGAIARWPGAIPASRVSNTPSQAHDWMPTFAEIAKVTAPARTDGVSLLPALTGKGVQLPSAVYVEYFVSGKTPTYAEFMPARRSRARRQMQAIRLGDFIGVRYDIKSHADPFEIYNVVADPQEAHDIGGELQYANLQRQMHDTVLRIRRPEPSAPRPYDRELVPAVNPPNLVPGVDRRVYARAAPWVAKLDTLAPSARSTSSQIDVTHVRGRPEFSILFSGYFLAPEDGEYTFTMTADTGALLRIHDAAVVDFDRGVASGIQSGTILLQKGTHPFRLYYRHKGPAAPSLTLQWNRPGGALEDIPVATGYHDETGTKP
jgi:arylsulfatase A-like enzyme